MLTLEQVFRAQAKYGVGAQARGIETVPYSSYLGELRRYMTDNTPKEYYSWEVKKQDDFTEKCIVEFVRRHNQLVDGFLDEQNELRMDALIDKLREDIIDSGILKLALNDPEIQELQINDCKTIFQVKGGLAEPYCDETGKPLQFENDEELHSAIDRLIYNPNGNTPRMTVTNPIMNTRTHKKGYRLSALDSSAITPDIKPGYDFPVTAVTLRKYSDFRLGFDDLVGFGSMTPKMAKFLRLCAIADIKIFFVGKTSSGKTTLATTMLDYYLQHTYEQGIRKRVICIQNPTEAMFYRRSPETLANLYNVMHWEAQDVDIKLAEDPTTPTMEHLLALALRHSPDIIFPGELRLATEFSQVYKALKFDQRIISTFHASDANDALNRWASELASLGGNMMDYLQSLATSIDLVVSQNRLDDKKRRVTGIEEVTGRILDGGVVDVNKIAGFEFSGEVKRDPATGKLLEICGQYKDNGKISQKLLQKFYAAGISKEDLADFI